MNRLIPLILFLSLALASCTAFQRPVTGKSARLAPKPDERTEPTGPVSFIVPRPEIQVIDPHPMAVLETFLGLLTEKQLEAAYGHIAPSSKAKGDPIAYNTPLDYESFVAEAEKVDPQKFAGYRIGASRWQGEHLYRVMVTLDGWDNDEVMIVKQEGRWYVADPIHIIR